MIRWDDRSTDVLLNPRLGAADLAEIRRLIGACAGLEAHIWLTTSGSTGRLKPVALSKAAVLAAADGVNRHLAATRDDVWCRPLPIFHVGGLGIHARAFRTGSGLSILERWDPFAFHNMLADDAVTLTSLVPTQVRDLLTHRLSPPPFLRAVLVGGGATPPDLWTEARALGWPLLPNYGATETGAQVATASLEDLDRPTPPPLHLLDHVEGQVTYDGRLGFKGPSLFTGYATADGLHDPKEDGWWFSGDRGTLSNGIVTVVGRVDDAIKIGGESVSLAALQARIETLLPVDGVTDAAVIDRPDPRLGSVLVLVVVGSRGGAGSLRKRYDESVLPFERAHDVVLLDEIPRTELRKVRRELLKQRLGY